MPNQDTITVPIRDGRSAEVVASKVTAVMPEKGGGGTEIWIGGREPIVSTDSVAVVLAALSPFAQVGLSFNELQIHKGFAYEAHNCEPDMDKTQEINICFTTPAGPNLIHAIFLPVSSTFARFHVDEGATVTGGTGTNEVAHNRNRNKSDSSAIISTNDSTTGSYTLNATVTAPGLEITCQMVGGSVNRGEAGGSRDVSEFILKADTKYAIRLIGNGIGADNGIANIVVDYQEHVF